jgi:UDP-N-acetylmuramate dehydrogenase
MRTLTHVSAIPYSTFRFDAKLASVIECASVEDLQCLDDAIVPIILGEGSNTIFMQDISVPLCRYVACDKQLTAIDNQHVLLHVEAGHNWHQLVTWAVQQQLWGIENLALIPGSVGAAPVQNIGAYGVELADSCLYVDFYHWQTKKVQRMAAGRCEFGYRNSIFKHALAKKGVIVAVGLCLSTVPSPVLAYKGLDHLAADSCLNTIYQQVIAVRSSKLPDPAALANCGSFFKNPIIATEQYEHLQRRFPDIPGFAAGREYTKVPAAWLIEQQGFKGSKLGEVGCYKLQPLVLVNYGDGTAQQLKALIAQIQHAVHSTYAIELEPEVRMLHDDELNND